MFESISNQFWINIGPMFGSISDPPPLRGIGPPSISLQFPIKLPLPHPFPEDRHLPFPMTFPLPPPLMD